MGLLDMRAGPNRTDDMGPYLGQFMRQISPSAPQGPGPAIPALGNPAPAAAPQVDSVPFDPGPAPVAPAQVGGPTPMERRLSTPIPPPKPQIDPAQYGWRAGAYGPAAGQAYIKSQTAPYMGEMAGILTRELLDGRPQGKPLHMNEVAGLLNAMGRPELLGDKAFMDKLQVWTSAWNRAAEQHNQRQARIAGNLYQSGKDLGAEYPPEQVALMNKFGWKVRQGPGAPGMLGQAASQPKSPGVRGRVFAGHYPSPDQRAAATARATQTEATRGHIARRRADQAIPPGQYRIQTDPASGRQRLVWTGGANQVDLGRKPYSQGDIRAQVMTKALLSGVNSLTPEEKQIWEVMTTQPPLMGLDGRIRLSGMAQGPGMADYFKKKTQEIEQPGRRPSTIPAARTGAPAAAKTPAPPAPTAPATPPARPKRPKVITETPQYRVGQVWGDRNGKKWRCVGIVNGKPQWQEVK